MLAYVDTHLAGLVKCKVLRRLPNGRMVVNITARNTMFERGAILDYSAERVVLRNAVKRYRFGTYTVRATDWTMHGFPVPQAVV